MCEAEHFLKPCKDPNKQWFSKRGTFPERCPPVFISTEPWIIVAFGKHHRTGTHLLSGSPFTWIGASLNASRAELSAGLSDWMALGWAELVTWLSH